METKIENKKAELTEKKQQLKQLQEDVEQLEDETYEQYVHWDTDVLKELSDVLADSKVTEVVIYEDYSEYEYMEKITTKNTLKDIVEALQQYYNQLKKDDRGGCFYIETVTIVKISTHKYELIFSHGT